MVDILHRNLGHVGIKTGKIHGGLSQNRRTEAIEMFHNHKFNILLASDVAARGLDIRNVSHIINYDIPKTSNEYIHRIGRTARAGKNGKVISLLCDHDYDNFRKVLEDRSLVVQKLETPDFQKIPFIKGERSREENRHYHSPKPFRDQGRYRKRNFRKHN